MMRVLTSFKVVSIAAALCFGVVCIFATWNAVHTYLQYRRYPQIGRSIDIGGRTLNLSCSGDGTPTVIFETFSHQAGLSWNAVQAEAATFTRACWYDRAGYGWSDRGPMPRTFKSNAEDLHSLLSAAHLAGPYVLVGSYDAASQIRVFNGLYKNDVAGAVFVDGNDVDVYAHHVDVPAPVQGPWQRAFGSFAPHVLQLACVVFPLGQRAAFLLPHFGRYRPTLSYGLPLEQKEELDFLSDRAFADACYVARNEADVLAAGDLGSRPLVVLASTEQMRSERDEKAAKAWNKWWVTEEEPRLAKLSTRGRLVRVNGQVEAKDIVDAIRETIHTVGKPGAN